MATSVDGRATRWAQHNAERRRELVEATLRAIRKHGHGIGMDDLAADAGTSKTVFYRHFGDRAGLYTAVVESVQEFILGNFIGPLAAELPPAQLVGTSDQKLLRQIHHFAIAGISPIHLHRSVFRVVARIHSFISKILPKLIHTAEHTDDQPL